MSSRLRFRTLHNLYIFAPSLTDEETLNGNFCIFKIWSRQFSCEIATGTPTLIKIALKLFLSMLLNTHAVLYETHASVSALMKRFHVVLNSTDMCVVFFFIIPSVTECEWHVCYSPPHPPHPQPTGKMAATEPHRVLSLCLDIHLGNSNRPIIMPSN